MAFLGVLLALATGLPILALALAFALTTLIAARVEARFPAIGQRVALPGGHLSLVDLKPEGAPRGTVVLLHGASANASDPLEGFGRRLVERGFRVVAVDRPGFGRSDRFDAERGASPAFQASIVADALQTLGVGPAIVFGHSWGGAPALGMALDRPDRVAGLLLAAPVAMAMPERPLPWWANLALTPPVTRLLTETIAVPLGLYYLPRVSERVFAPEPPVADYLDRSRSALILRPGPALANIRDLAGLPAALRAQAPRYGTLRLPVTIVAGDADPIVDTAKQAAPLSAAVPEARLVRLPGVGHMLHYTAAERIVAEIEALQARIDAGVVR